MNYVVFLFSLLAFLPLSAQTLPQDTAYHVGRLDNGLTYYLRHNAKGKGLADFYIAQRVGSILEEPRQRGLAHFLEHMAFNGTKHFPGKDGQLGIVPWCETIGVKFGANLNAYTSVDQTACHIGSAPLKREGILDSCLLVLNDWSHYILLEDKEIDKERGVIHEEWRTRRAGMAMQRLMEDAMPIIYRGSKYEDCMPIGSMDIVDNFPYQDLRDYYQKWYRPDLQAIIVVGDIDVDQVERKVKALFSQIPKPVNPAERIYYPVPDNDRMIVSIQKDKEQPIVLCHLYQKRNATPDGEKNTTACLRGSYIDELIGYMLNSRLGEIRQQAQPPFLSASGHASEFFVSRTKDAFSLSVSCKQGDILGSLNAAVACTERASQHGFTQEELNRAKKISLTAAERRYKERNERRNSYFVNQCVQHFLKAEPLTSEEFDLGNTRQLDRNVTLDEVNRAVRELITNQNQVCVLYAPDKEDVQLPTEEQLEAAVLQAQQREYAAYVEAQLPKELISQLPKPGSIVSEQPYKHGFTELTLSNGMKVYVRPTDFTADQVQMTMKAEGHVSLDELRPLLCQYMATLPSTHRHEQTNWDNVPSVVDGRQTVRFTKQQATPLANVSIVYSADVPFTPQSDLELDFLRRCLSIAYTDSVREEKGGTYGVSVEANLDKEERPNATLKISYNADPNRYAELNPIIYQQLRNIADHGPEATSMDKVKQYLTKQYQQLAIDDDYWDYIIWHELEDSTDFDHGYCELVEQMTAAQVQQMARRLLDANRCIEVTMLSGTPKTALLRIDDMHCQKCADRIRTQLIQMAGIEDETIDRVLSIDGVGDANVNAQHHSLAVKYHHQEISAKKLLRKLRKANIKAELPKPHECSEEK